MKNIWKIWLASVLAVFVLAACGGTATKDEPKVDDTQQLENSNEVEEAAFPLTLTDAVGNEVTLEKAPERIVSMMPSNTEILFGLGLDDEVVGVTDFDNYPEAALEKEKIGAMEFNVEAIIALNPELVLGHESAFGMSEEGYEQIRGAGIPVFVVKNAENFNETYETIETIGKTTGKTEEAAKMIEEMKAKVEEVLAKVAEIENKKTVLVEVSPAPEIYTTGGDTFMNELLTMVNAENLFGDLDGWPEIDGEQIIDRNPDVILTTYGSYVENPMEHVKERDGFDTVTAVKNDAIVDIDEDLTSRQGPRLALGLEEIAKAIYPEVFGE